MKIYVTFGQAHAHHVNGKTFDKDCVCEIECMDMGDGRRQAFAAFGDKFFTAYQEEKLPSIISYFPRGILPLRAEP